MHLIRRHFQTVDSTNTWAKHHLNLLVREGITVVTADSQTAGRGTYERHWVSPPKQNIYASFCFFLNELKAEIANIPQVLSISLVKVLATFEIEAKIKWPNDVLVSGKKIAGILTETVTSDNGEVCVIVGVGMNVNMPLETALEIGRPVTSLFIETGNEYDVALVFNKLQKEFVSDLYLFFEKGFSLFIDEYCRHFFVSLSQNLRCRDGKKEVEGVFEGINDRGALILSLKDGSLKTLITGEVYTGSV